MSQIQQQMCKQYQKDAKQKKGQKKHVNVLKNNCIGFARCATLFDTMRTV